MVHTADSNKQKRSETQAGTQAQAMETMIFDKAFSRRAGSADVYMSMGNKRRPRIRRTSKKLKIGSLRRVCIYCVSEFNLKGIYLSINVKMLY